MVQRKRRVRFHGVVRSDEHYADCTVMALEVSIPGMPPAYTQFSIVYVAKPLPDGVYKLTVNGETIEVRRQHRHWVAAHPM